MAGTSTKMSVDVSQFKSGMQQAQAAARTLDAELKRNEAQFKATGNAEQYMADKTRLLQMQLQTQKAAVTQIEGALQKMRDAGVSKTSVEYQKLQTQLSNAQTAMLNTSVELNNLATGEQNAAKGADQLAASVGGINKKMSLDQVITGIDKITGAMEKAAKKAAELGQAIWDNIMDSAKWSDDTATAAMLLDMNVEDYQRYKGVFDTIGELTVQDWIKAKQKVQKAIYDASQDQTDFLTLLGIPTHEMVQGKYGVVEGAAREWEDVFWDVVTETQKRIENGSMTQDAADTFFNNFFGRSFTNLKPLMKLGREGFAAALEEQNVASEDAVNKMAELNDRVTKLKDDFGKLQTEVLSGLAPALTEGAKALDELLGKIMEYLQTPEGQQALQDLGTAVSGLFEDLGKIDPEQVVSGFQEVFDKIVSGVQWVVKHKDDAIAALKAVVVGWGGLKLAGGALEVMKLVNGIRGLTGGAEAAAAAGAAAGTSWGTAFAEAVAAAAPWLVGAYMLLNPAGTGDNSMGDANGNLTPEGWADYENALTHFAKTGEKDWNGWIEDLLMVGELFEGLDKISLDENAVQAISRFRTTGRNTEQLISDLQALGYILKLTDEELLPKYEYPEEVKQVPIIEEPTVNEEAAEESWEEMLERLGMQECEIEVDDFDVPDDAAAMISEQIGSVPIMIDPVVPDTADGYPHANGLWSVPWDGYPAILHRGERVLTARENRNYTFNSNHYFGTVNLNNGLEIEALTESIDRRNRRQRSGYGAN